MPAAQSAKTFCADANKNVALRLIVEMIFFVIFLSLIYYTKIIAQKNKIKNNRKGCFENITKKGGPLAMHAKWSG
jgi:hypothetical protein